MFSRYKDSQNCCDLIAEALDPDGKISPLQVTRALKQLGYKIPRKKNTLNASAPDKHRSEVKVLESDLRLQNSDILEVKVPSMEDTYGPYEGPWSMDQVRRS